MKKVLILSIGIAMMTFSCQQKQQATPSSPGSGQNVKLINDDVCLPGNESNTYDQIGADHNYELYYLESSGYTANNTLADFVNYQKTWRLNNGRPVSEYQSFYLSLQSLINDEPNNHELLNTCGLSEPGKVYINYLKNANNFIGDDFCAVKEKFVIKETAIQNDGLLATAEKTRLLEAYSIARYSSFHHLNPSPINPQPAPEAFYISAWTWGLIFADVKGYIVGSDVDVNTTPEQSHEHGLEMAAQYSWEYAVTH